MRGDAPIALPAAWWPVALGHEVTGKPQAIQLAEVGICVYREPSGQARAVLDVCPHRRLPLSLGWTTDEGFLQCGYHGWCFDGATGQCKAIPNLNAEERVSPSIRVAVFATVEQVRRRMGRKPAPAEPRTARPTLAPDDTVDALAVFTTTVLDGFVYVWSGPPDAEADSPTPVAGAPAPDELRLGGVFEVRAPYQKVADAIALNPGKALGLGPLFGAGEEVVAPQVDVQSSTAIVRRERRLLDVPRVATFEPHGRRIARTIITTSAITGLTRVDAESELGDLTGHAVVGLTPVNEYRTTVRWWGEVTSPRGPAAVAVLTAARAAGRKRRAQQRCEALVDQTDEDQGLADPGVRQRRRMR